MSYIKYDVDVSQGMYADYERLRRDYVGKRLTRDTALTMLDLIGLPSASPKVFSLAVKYELLLKHGQARGTYYMVPKEIVPFSRFEGMENDFYNGSKPEPKPKKEEKVTEKETARVVLDEDYCLRYLKERGYMCFRLTPNLLRLQQVFTPEFLLQSMEAELR